MIDLLSETIFRVESDGEDRSGSLAGVLTDLLTSPSGRIRFTGLLAEQRSHWWRFLVRCAAKALHEDEVSLDMAAGMDCNDLSELIRNRLSKAAGDQEAWHLYQPDPARPGFLQPPVPNGLSLADFAVKPVTYLSTSIGSKNHERKADQVTRRIDTGWTLDPEQAVFALVEFQGGAIYAGRGNYGSQLMGSASGKGSGTPFMGIRLPAGTGPTFRHDVGVLMGRWSSIRDDGLKGDVWALWARPWDLKTRMPAAELDPSFIPMARMVRLPEPVDGHFPSALFKASKSARVLDHTEGGVLGDPFTPLIAHEGAEFPFKVRGTMERGYDHREIAEFFLGTERRLSPSVEEFARSRGPETGGHAAVLLEGTAFDQGKTLGFHRREVLLPVDELRNVLEEPEPFRTAHTYMIERVSDVDRALRAAVRVLLHGSPQAKSGDDARVGLVSTELHDAIDEVYLDRLFEAGAKERGGDQGYQGAWVVWLDGTARDVFERVMPRYPTPHGRRYERLVKPRAYLERRLFRIRLDEGLVRSNEESLESTALASPMAPAPPPAPRR